MGIGRSGAREKILHDPIKNLRRQQAPIRVVPVLKTSSKMVAGINLDLLDHPVRSVHGLHVDYGVCEVQRWRQRNGHLEHGLF